MYILDQIYTDYANNPDANKVFRNINCFQNAVKYETSGWTLSYCVTSSLEVVGYLVLFALSTFVMVIQVIFHWKVHGGKCDCLSFWKKDRHKIFFFVQIMLIASITKEMFIVGNYSWPLLLTAQLMRFLVIAVSTYSFLNDATALIEKSKIIYYMIFLQVSIACSILTFIIIGVVQEVNLFVKDR